MKIHVHQTHKPLTLFSYSSLTDIVLLLLIFFLLTSSFIVTTGLKVNLPTAGTTQKTDAERIVVTLRADGMLFVDGVQVERRRFEETIAARLTNPEQQVIVLSSDKEAALEHAVFILDASKRRGASRFFISTHPSESYDEIQ